MDELTSDKLSHLMRWFAANKDAYIDRKDGELLLAELELACKQILDKGKRAREAFEKVNKLENEQQ